ncbi:hypothetical protein CVT26_001352 [Gymnopilus dilepis]|uniref:Uncharacterized protein n=1 Tax=Gymnopilus dilepis TaxID=231916 RepID=A0A409WBH9_9AGAR|nr:hypothetical protein CVT26_001352 [Gymnopilus dilepis]
MAEKKPNTARKTTGGKAPSRKQPARAAAKKATLTNVKTTQGRSKGAPAPRKALGALGFPIPAPKQDALVGHSTMDHLYVPKPSQGVTFELQPKQVAAGVCRVRMSEDTIGDDGNEWCSHCKDGGKLNLCSLCRQGFCQRCIVLLEGTPCPLCHLIPGHMNRPLDGWGKRSYEPYLNNEGAIIEFRTPQTTRDVFSIALTETLVVICIRLQGIASYEAPIESIYLHLQPWLKGNVAFVDLDYNLAAGAPIKNWFKRLNALCQELETGALKRFTRVSVYLVTHSTPDFGDLHSEPNNNGAATVSEVFKVLFTDRLQRILTRMTSKTLTILTCGAVLGCRDSMQDLKMFSQQSIFDRTIAFSQPHLQLSLLSLFLQRSAELLFIQDKTGFEPLLLGSESLGAHTSIVVFEGSKGTRYVWAHIVDRPFGQEIPFQCTCGALKSFQLASKTETKITLCCRTCMAAKEFDAPLGLTWINPTAQSDRHGLWFKLELEDD